MIEVKKNKAKLWSRLGARATFGQAILEMARERDDYEYCPAGKNLSEMIDEYRKKN